MKVDKLRLFCTHALSVAQKCLTVTTKSTDLCENPAKYIQNDRIRRTTALKTVTWEYCSLHCRWTKLNKEKIYKKLCAWRHDMPPPLSSSVGAPAPRAPPSRRNVAVVSDAQYVLTVTAAPASRVKAALSKAAWWPWPLTFWPWKWCPSHVWRGLPLCHF